ncbi:hypothetical protein TEQG_07502 [Trichophyton equinum CBS 127.97]|uniref:Uncharacterized protein n=1 Tax=Trichophyton equinum (strain ATCC MYA-4606 / CBS 127.97) TaxID=559882 RepID=F2Q366_TRIEC|nr:hypothetical protein TEQG_07502 [Trichophyton equinum CBS 127.97]
MIDTSISIERTFTEADPIFLDLAALLSEPSRPAAALTASLWLIPCDWHAEHSHPSFSSTLTLQVARVSIYLDPRTYPQQQRQQKEEDRSTGCMTSSIPPPS